MPKKIVDLVAKQEESIYAMLGLEWHPLIWMLETASNLSHFVAAAQASANDRDPA